VETDSWSEQWDSARAPAPVAGEIVYRLLEGEHCGRVKQ
jgi:hypothetical protein